MKLTSVVILLAGFFVGCSENDLRSSSEDPALKAEEDVESAQDDGWADHGIGIYRTITFTESREYHERFQEYHSKIKLEEWPQNVKGITLGYKFRWKADNSMEWGGLTGLTVRYENGEDRCFEVPEDKCFETWLESIRAKSGRSR